MFNDYKQVIKSTGAKLDAKHEISDISLEYEIVTQPDLARHASDEYQNMAFWSVLWVLQDVTALICCIAVFSDTDKLE